MHKLQRVMLNTVEGHERTDKWRYSVLVMTMFNKLSTSAKAIYKPNTIPISNP